MVQNVQTHYSNVKAVTDLLNIGTFFTAMLTHTTWVLELAEKQAIINCAVPTVKSCPSSVMKLEIGTVLAASMQDTLKAVIEECPAFPFPWSITCWQEKHHHLLSSSGTGWFGKCQITPKIGQLAME